MTTETQTAFVCIPTLTANIVREVELVLPEELARGEYLHTYGDGSEEWLTAHDGQHEALAEARRFGRFVHVE